MSILAQIVAGFLLHGALAKQISIYPRQDVYVEQQRPTWSYRTAVLQVGKAQDGGDSEYRAFLGFDLTPLVSSGARIVSAKLRLHPLLASANALLGRLDRAAAAHSDTVAWLDLGGASAQLAHALLPGSTTSEESAAHVLALASSHVRLVLRSHLRFGCDEA